MNDSATVAMAHLKLRDGTVTGTKFNDLASALDWLGNDLAMVKGSLFGHFLLIDLKSPPKKDPNNAKVTGYAALKASWALVKAKAAQYPQFNDPGSKAPGLGKAVAFKIKARELPTDPKTLEQDLGLKGDGTDQFYLVPVMHPDDAEAGNNVMQNYLHKPYLLTAEPNMSYIEQPYSDAWYSQLKLNGFSIPGFPGWNEYPQGVAVANGICCLYRNVDPSQPDLDYTGSYSYQMAIEANWLTADMAEDLHKILSRKGYRNLFYLTPTEVPQPKLIRAKP
jgi:hypothetical protein